MRKLERGFSKKLIFILFVSFTLICSADLVVTVDEYSVIQESGNYVVYDHYYPVTRDDSTSISLDVSHPALQIMRERAKRIGSIKWTPLGEVPKRDGSFTTGMEVTGIPYSSVKELDKFVGQEVSFYTFLSAINNPRSVIYTENVGQTPYNGVNCAAYYGTVCSMTVNYALGLDRPYSTSMYGSLPFIQTVTNQDLEHAAPGDIIYFTYVHVILIADIERDSEGNALYIHILESTGDGTSYRRYGKERVENRLKQHEWVLYRYKDLAQLSAVVSPNPSMEEDLNTKKFVSELCPSRGDKSSYREGEDVILNLMTNKYEKVEILRDGMLFDLQEIDRRNDIVLDSLPNGSYKVSLMDKNGNHSDCVQFEVLQTKVKLKRYTELLKVSFASDNAQPEYLVFCKLNGGRTFITNISDSDRQSGNKWIKCDSDISDLYVKVFFRGEYGRVSNPIMPLL